jgi:hypothetical protein
MTSSLSIAPPVTGWHTTDTTQAPSNPHAIKVLGLSTSIGLRFGEFVTDYGDVQINSIMAQVNHTLLPYTQRSKAQNVAELWPNICKLSGQTFENLPDTPLPLPLWQIVAQYAQEDFFQSLDERRGPVLKDMNHSQAWLDKCRELFGPKCANNIIEFLTKYKDTKLYPFYTSEYFLSRIMGLDCTYHNETARTGIEGNWPLVTSSIPIPGNNAHESDKYFTDAFFTEKTSIMVQNTKAPDIRDEGTRHKAVQLLQKCLGTKALATSEDVELFDTFIGRMTGYSHKECMDHHLLWEAGLIPAINRAKAFHTETLNDPKFDAQKVTARVLQSDVAFLQNCNTLLYRFIEPTGYELSSSSPMAPVIVTNPAIWKSIALLQNHPHDCNRDKLTTVHAIHLPTQTPAILMAVRFSRRDPLTTSLQRIHMNLEGSQTAPVNPIKFIAAIGGIPPDQRVEFLRKVNKLGWKTTTPDPNWITQWALSLQWTKIGVPRPADTTYFITNESEFTQAPGSATRVYFPNVESPSGHAPMSATTFMRV